MKRLALVCVATAAAADPKLVLDHEPPPRTLHMRPKKLAQTPPPPAKRATPMPAAPSVSATAPDPIGGLDGLRDVRQKVSFSVDLGYQVDGARPNGRAGLGWNAPVEGQDYAKLRSYGFGEVFGSTRGLLMPSLEGYFALRFQAARTITTTADDINQHPIDAQVPSPVATWFDRSGFELRTGWGELKDFLPQRLGLQRLRVRAGDQFVYGPWILHLDGIFATYEGPTITASLYTGARHSDYTRGPQSDRRPLAGGGDLRFDLRGLRDNLPIAASVEFMTLSASDETGQDQVNTELAQIDWRPRRDVVVIGSMRGVNGNLANQRVEVRTRYRQVTNFVFEVTRRYLDDWRWDPSLVTYTPGDLTEARRYLDLGPVLPQLIASARAGTLIRENIDLFARVAAATDLENTGGKVDTFSAPYVEVGGAVEVRLRRQVAVGLSGLRRQTRRVIDIKILDEHGPLEPLPDSTQMGEDSFTELGMTTKMTLGARKFSAMVEVYGRKTNYANVYEDPIAPLPLTDLRGGGRFTIDSWVGRRVKLFVSYDLSSALDTAPDINGYKSLRMMVSGIY